MVEQVDRGSGRGQALVPLEAEAETRHYRPMAGFVTQLIACHRRLPAYRQARRAEPDVAAARYGVTRARSVATFDSDA